MGLDQPLVCALPQLGRRPAERSISAAPTPIPCRSSTWSRERVGGLAAAGADRAGCCRPSSPFRSGSLPPARRGRAGDTIAMGAAQLGVAVPNFWFALMLIYLFAVWLRLVPAGGFPGWSAGVWPALKALHPAGHRARPAAGGDPGARHPLGADRGAGRGLHPHRPRQGPALPRCAVAARAAQRA